ncbi:MAG TPA: response regulator transcription factor [Saprospiraceae bacterium]|nr:response regulator transcription factor [Saprospiraceae bacterium]
MSSSNSGNWWKHLALYGIPLGLLMASLQYSRLHLLTYGQSEKWYIAFIAILFAAVGIWAGMRWNRKYPLSSPTAPLPVLPKEQLLAGLGITPRELEVLEQMAEGKSNQEIAESLFVSLNTVKTHLSNLFSKLDVQRRTQAIQKAKSLGLLP